MSKLPPCSHANAGGPLCCLVCLRAALAAASDKLIEWEAALAAAEAKLADERRHADELDAALRDPDSITVERARAAHAARRAAEKEEGR